MPQIVNYMSYIINMVLHFRGKILTWIKEIGNSIFHTELTQFAWAFIDG